MENYEEASKVYDIVMEVEVRISKPEAPVDATFKNISVTSIRKRHTAYIALGSNEGDSLKIIEDALKDIDQDSSCKLIKQSTIMRSTPYEKQNIREKEIFTGDQEPWI